MSATPRPWSLDTFEPMSNDHSQWETCTISGAGTPGTIATTVRIENAALIVDAVNAYDGLMVENARLKAALELARRLLQTLPQDSDNMQFIRGALRGEGVADPRS